MKLGDNILKLRKDCKLSQEQLAEKLMLLDKQYQIGSLAKLHQILNS